MFIYWGYENEDSGKWKHAINEEKDSLEKNKTEEYTNLQSAKGKKILRSKWVFKIKEDGQYKTRLIWTKNIGWWKWKAFAISGGSRPSFYLSNKTRPYMTYAVGFASRKLI